MRFLIIAAIFTITLAAADLVEAQTILWDQQPDTSIAQIIDQDIPDQAIFSTYAVNDVTFGTTVIVNSVTTYYTNAGGAWASNVTQGVLNIFDGDALAQGDDPSAGGGDFGLGTVNVTVTDLGNNVLAVTASGFDIFLSSGTYWFGLTAVASSSLPQEFHYSAASTIGFESQFRNPGGGFGLGTDWGVTSTLSPTYQDTALTVTMAYPEPTSAGFLAIGLIGLVARRRRR